MAFNFNWSPLVADTSRARDMLTTALNKMPRPAIIVDDIIVTELNLGSVPPELEILEIGDLAEDRFRGIFKMSYTGDAFLTLKTKVQANPLNTYLAGKRKFAAPDTVAASSGLTIPIQITLSEIRLSGFVILVFSKTKGVTVVFRNDPLESLKVSSTFDSIPFIKDYLQKEIEGQLRVLFVEDLPAIIHRLSLRMFSPEYREMDDKAVVDADQRKPGEESAPIDPLASPVQGPVDPFGDGLDDGQAFSLSGPSEAQSFSQKNLLRLSALTDSQHTLSLFTPSIRDAVFRAWAGAAERGDLSGTATPNLTAHSSSKVQSTLGTSSDTSSVYSLQDSVSDSGTMSSSRPSLFSQQSTHGLSSHGRSKRKGKRRVVDLRKKKPENDDAESTTTGTTASSPAATVAPTMAAPSLLDEVIMEEKEEDLQTPESSPQAKQRARRASAMKDLPQRPLTYTSDPVPGVSVVDFGPPLPTQPASSKADAKAEEPPAYSPPNSGTRPTLPEKARSQYPMTSVLTSPTRQRPGLPMLRSYSQANLSTVSHPAVPSNPNLYLAGSHMNQENSGGILEQAWMMKMASDLARKVAAEKARQGGQSEQSSPNGKKTPPRQTGRSEKLPGAFWEGQEEGEMSVPPPAYSR